jgi:hypothetical protein
MVYTCYELRIRLARSDFGVLKKGSTRFMVGNDVNVLRVCSASLEFSVVRKGVLGLVMLHLSYEFSRQGRCSGCLKGSTRLRVSCHTNVCQSKSLELLKMEYLAQG